jgi:hypothetical protein
MTGPTRKRRRILRRLYRTKTRALPETCVACESEERLCLNGHPDGPELAPLCVDCWALIRELALGSQALAFQRVRRLIYRHYRARGDRPVRAWMRTYWIVLVDPRQCATDPRENWHSQKG